MVNNIKSVIPDGEKVNLVLDCDEILCCISPKWVFSLYNDYNFFKKYLNIPEKLELTRENFNRILMRPYFFLDSWLFKHDKKFTKEEVKEFKTRFIEIYDSKNFYDDLEPTPFANAISYLALQHYIKNIYIVTRTTPNNKDSKERFLSKLFGTTLDKVQIFYLEKDEKKSDVIKNLNNISIVADDELENLEDIAMNCNNIKGANFYVPKYGYNRNPSENLLEACKNKKVIFNYFE